MSCGLQEAIAEQLLEPRNLLNDINIPVHPYIPVYHGWLHPILSGYTTMVGYIAELNCHNGKFWM